MTTDEGTTLWQERAKLLLRLHRPADAAQLAARQLTLDAHDVTAYITLAQALLAQSQLVEAAEAASAAAAIDPEEPAAYYLLAVALQYQNRYKAAEAPLATALRLNPYEPDYHGRRSVNLYFQKRLRPALEAANAGLAINPHHSDCLLWRAMTSEALHRPEAADRAFETLLRLAPTNAGVHANRGIMLFHRNEPEAARYHFLEALRFDPNQRLALDYLPSVLEERPLPLPIPASPPLINAATWWGWLAWLITVAMSGEVLSRPALQSEASFAVHVLVQLGAVLMVLLSSHRRMQARWWPTALWVIPAAGVAAAAWLAYRNGNGYSALLWVRMNGLVPLINLTLAFNTLQKKQRQEASH
ncbi:tetratricopeptide repeat protein [Hymenobacter koreensis]|uniref:Tetratricopeptide repeat protein n=1 Tax=Hymenobacter koreensis TaxID=1084523 RepID=A0ABP8ITW1_9BACT